MGTLSCETPLLYSVPPQGEMFQISATFSFATIVSTSSWRIWFSFLTYSVLPTLAITPAEESVSALFRIQFCHHCQYLPQGNLFQLSGIFSSATIFNTFSRTICFCFLQNLVLPSLSIPPPGKSVFHPCQYLLHETLFLFSTLFCFATLVNTSSRRICFSNLPYSVLPPWAQLFKASLA